jgi:hypothetical protein
MAQSQSPEALYQQIGSLLASVPDLTDFDANWNLPDATMAWLGRASALIHAADPLDIKSIKFDVAAENLVKTLNPSSQARQIILILNMVLAKLEAQVPAASRGAFVSAGDEFDAIAALASILSEGKADVLIVDPYMDERALMDFGVLVREGVQLRLLSDEATHKPGLKPAADRWIAQYAHTRPLAIRIAPARSLHDRLIVVDSTVTWILTQSLKDFAKRSHAVIQRGDPELAKMKIEAFSALWDDGMVVAETL